MNLSETTFIVPREPEVEATNGKRVRIFTTREELPFAGHPTLGTALYLYSTTNTAPDEIVLDLNVGKIPVRFTADSTRARNNRAEGDVFGEMRQRDPTSGGRRASDWDRYARNCFGMADPSRLDRVVVRDCAITQLAHISSPRVELCPGR
jgi:trans-2,3-dihydro-3-hydroxyanthranilate isomerase